MANSILGAGIVGLPYAVREAGFVTGILLLVVLGAVTSWTVKLMGAWRVLSDNDMYKQLLIASKLLVLPAVVNAKLTGQKSYNDMCVVWYIPLVHLAQRSHAEPTHILTEWNTASEDTAGLPSPFSSSLSLLEGCAHSA